MEAFEDENPFESEPERGLHFDSSSSCVDIAAMPSSPTMDVPTTPTFSPPTSPSRRNTFPSPGSHRQPQAYKSDYCCARDSRLHSGEDVQIEVSIQLWYKHMAECSLHSVGSRTTQITDALKTTVNSSSPYITYVKSG